MQQIYLESYFKKGYRSLMKYIYDILNHSQRKIIEEKVRIIKFFDEYGERATKEAFLRGRSTIFLWKKKLKDGKGRLSTLALLSKAPKNPRKTKVSQQIKDFIRDYRLKYHGVGKEIIAPPLDDYCKRLGINSVSESTVGRIIKELKEKGLILDENAKLSFYAKTGRFIIKRSQPRYKKLRRGNYYPEKAGDLVQIDSIVIFLNGLKRYLITAIDLVTEFGFAYTYKTLSSSTARDFMEKLRFVAPFEIKQIQTDNGAEFEKHFREYVKKHQIIHFHNYPRHPQSNAKVERFNRTLQDRYVSWHLDDLYEPEEEFNPKLMKWLLWYNTEKPHRTLDKIPPLRYYLNNYIKEIKKSNMLWTLTKT